MKLKRNDGFTLIEVIVVAGIIAVLAGILVPIIFKEIDESKKTRALADIKSISTSLMVFKKDTGSWPTLTGACAPGVTLLVGSGNMPANYAAMGFDDASKVNLSEPLSLNSGACYTNWKGPYMATVTADPWGNAYIINADALSGTGAVWILSAGPNGSAAAGGVETSAVATVVAGDDIGIRIQ